MREVAGGVLMDGITKQRRRRMEAALERLEWRIEHPRPCDSDIKKGWRRQREVESLRRKLGKGAGAPLEG